MCLLTFIPGGIQPDLDALSCGTEINPDGHGWAIVTGSRLLVGHSMNPVEAIDAFAEARGRHPDGPALFHSRYATAGRVDVDNCHPFVVGGDPRTVLAHNGVLPGVVQPGAGEWRCDTRIAAEEFLPRFGSLRSRAARLRFERWMTPRNKIVILTVDRRFRDQAYILNEQAGIWYEGIWYSNDGYLPQPGWWTGWDEDDEQWWASSDRCLSCGRASTMTRAGQCLCCDFCPDCGQLLEHCQCYTPAHLAQPLDWPDEAPDATSPGDRLLR
jgi:hypothetical protein